MAKAQIEIPDGISVKLEGTPEEIGAVLKDLKVKGKAGGIGKAKAKEKGGKVTIPRLIEERKNEGFFKKTKTLGDVERRLGKKGPPLPSNYAFWRDAGRSEEEEEKVETIQGRQQIRVRAVKRRERCEDLRYCTR